MMVSSLSLYYGEAKAIEEVSLNLPDRRVTAIIGPSGCGKSSFLRALNRTAVLIPRVRIEGEVRLDGRSVYADDIDAAGLRMAVGYIFQKPNPFPASIYNNVAYGPRLQRRHYRRETDELVETALKQAALWDEVKDKLRKSAYNLSGGQQQRLCIARALAVRPQVLLMDEPCSALDPVSTQRIEDLISHLRKDLAVVIVTHNMQQASRISDFTAFFLSERSASAGRLVEYAPTPVIFTRPSDKRTEDFITGRFG